MLIWLSRVFPFFFLSLLVFVLSSGVIAGPRRRRLRRSMSISAASAPLVRFGVILNEYIRKRNSDADKDADLKFAAGMSHILYDQKDVMLTPTFVTC